MFTIDPGTITYADGNPIAGSDPSGYGTTVEYSLGASLAATALSVQQLRSTSDSIDCIFQKVDDELELIVIKILVSEFPDLPLPPPRDPTTKYAGGKRYDPSIDAENINAR